VASSGACWDNASSTSDRLSDAVARYQLTLAGVGRFAPVVTGSDRRVSSLWRTNVRIFLRGGRRRPRALRTGLPHERRQDGSSKELLSEAFPDVGAPRVARCPAPLSASASQSDDASWERPRQRCSERRDRRGKAAFKRQPMRVRPRRGDRRARSSNSDRCRVPRSQIGSRVDNDSASLHQWSRGPPSCERRLRGARTIQSTRTRAARDDSSSTRCSRANGRFAHGMGSDASSTL
jgi:hypothetical protein